MDAPIHYIQMPLGVWKTDLRRLLAEVPWEDRVEARREAFMAETPLSYTYGRGVGVRTYTAAPFAAGVDQVLVEVNRALRRRADLGLPLWVRRPVRQDAQRARSILAHLGSPWSDAGWLHGLGRASGSRVRRG